MARGIQKPEPGGRWRGPSLPRELLETSSCFVRRGGGLLAQKPLLPDVISSPRPAQVFPGRGSPKPEVIPHRWGRGAHASPSLELLSFRAVRQRGRARGESEHAGMKGGLGNGARIRILAWQGDGTPGRGSARGHCARTGARLARVKPCSPGDGVSFGFLLLLLPNPLGQGWEPDRPQTLLAPWLCRVRRKPPAGAGG